jgi:hypothetical protein
MGGYESVPASEAMPEQTARWCEAHTRGQLVACGGSDGRWYLTESGPGLSIRLGGAGAPVAVAGAVSRGR